jgi:hypothetical protein
MLLPNKQIMIRDILQDIMSRNKGVIAVYNESRHESGQSVLIGYNGIFSAIVIHQDQRTYWRRVPNPSGEMMRWFCALAFCTANYNKPCARHIYFCTYSFAAYNVK